MKLTGLQKVPDVTLKRGIVAPCAYQWLDDIRDGSQNALRTVTIQLENEDHTATVQTWKLLRARIVSTRAAPSTPRAATGDGGTRARLRALEMDKENGRPEIADGTTRDRPYGIANFLVDFGDGKSQSPAGGFSEVIFPSFDRSRPLFTTPP